MTESHHTIFFRDSRDMKQLGDSSVQLVVTSPPYPMIEMWDSLFGQLNPRIEKLFGEASSPMGSSETSLIYDLMHEQLAIVWRECYRVLCQGGMACINIGDATRSIGRRFRLFPNHSRVIEHCEKIGFTTLPFVLWKKPTNKPNAFLGSGFLPTNGYVTSDFEYVLIFRKGEIRRFQPKDPRRYESKFTKAQRDVWFSQVWSIHGAAQALDISRRRSAAFPDELPRRLIRMFSVAGDTVLDPFLGTGTTTNVAGQLSRNSIGFEMDESLRPIICKRLGIEDSASTNDLQFKLP